MGDQKTRIGIKRKIKTGDQKKNREQKKYSATRLQEMQQFPQGSGSKQINRNQKKMLISTVLTNSRFPSPWVTKAVLTQKLKELDGFGGRAQRHTPDAAPVASKDAALPSSFLPCLHPGTCCVRYYCLPIRLPCFLSFLDLLSFLHSFLSSFLLSVLPSFLHSLP